MIEMKIHDCLKAIDGELLSGAEDRIFRGVSIDSRTLNAGELFVCIRGDRFDGHNFLQNAVKKKAAGVVVSDRAKAPSEQNKQAPPVICANDTLTALQELARFHREQIPVRVVGVTGTNGKSTTKEMIASITKMKFKTLKTRGNLNNHIGLPLNLFRLSKDDRVAVLEMGMSATGEIKRLAEIAQPEIGVLTNISEGHLTQLKTLKNIQTAKGELYDSLSEQGTAVVNADDPLVLELAKSVRAKVITYGIHKDADVRAEDIRPRDKEGFDFTVRLFDQTISTHLPFIGSCNIYNALAAMATGYTLGLEPEDMKAGLNNCNLLSQRYEITELKGVTVINDTYNANPRSMLEAMKTLAQYPCKGRRFLVIGDMLELGKLAEPAHRQLGTQVGALSIDYLVAVGEFSAFAAQGAADAGMGCKRIASASERKCAVAFLKKHVRPGDCLLVKGSRGSKMEEVVNSLAEEIASGRDG